MSNGGPPSVSHIVIPLFVWRVIRHMRGNYPLYHEALRWYPGCPHCGHELGLEGQEASFVNGWDTAVSKITRLIEGGMTDG